MTTTVVERPEVDRPTDTRPTDTDTDARADRDAGQPPAAATPARRSGRLVGIDIARAFALIGMFTQHVFIADSGGDGSTGWVAWLFRESAGRAAVLFFLLSGVSLAMIHRNGSFSATPAVLRRRGLLLLGGGILLTLTVFPPSILQHYGVAFLLAPWLLRLGWRGLGTITLAGLVGGPIALLWQERIGSVLLGWWRGDIGEWLLGTSWSLLASGIYPMVIWIGFFTLGIMIGRTRLDARRVAATLAVGGIAATLMFGTAAKYLADQFGTDIFFADEVGDFDFGDLDAGDFDADGGSVDDGAVDEAAVSGGDTPVDLDALTDAELGAKVRAQDAAFDREFGALDDDDLEGFDEYGDEFGGFTEFVDDDTVDKPIVWRTLYDTTGHSGAIGWTLQTSGIAIAVLGLALLITGRLQRLLRPLAILGSMSLTAYLVHIALVNDVWDARVAETSWSVIGQEWAFAGLVTTMLVTCLIFYRWLGTGPFEKLLKHFTARPGDRSAADG